MIGDEVIVAIVHTAAVSFIVVPMFDTTLASHTARKSGCRNGIQGDGAVLLISDFGLLLADVSKAKPSLLSYMRLPKTKNPKCISGHSCRPAWPILTGLAVWNT